MYLQKEIERLIDTAISEDVGSGDITTEVLVPEDAVISGSFVMKQAGITAGLPYLNILFQKIDHTIKATPLVEEGSYQKAGTIIAKVTGPARGILTGERIALNLIQHASAVATSTNEYVRKLRGLKCEILDTRKTLPGLRALEKYAVRIGGGSNHRFTLDDLVIIKNNHLYFLTGSSGTAIKTAIQKAKSKRPDLAIEVEISDTKLLPPVLESEAKAVMLSRMMPSEIKKCVRLIHKADKKAFVESLGTITLDTVRAYAETGVDGISIGAITFAVPPLEIVMRLK